MIVRPATRSTGSWLEDGLDVREIQLLLGHAKLEVTRRYLNIMDVGVVRSMRELWGRRRVAAAPKDEGRPCAFQNAPMGASGACGIPVDDRQRRVEVEEIHGSLRPLVTLSFASWNLIGRLLKKIDALRPTAWRHPQTPPKSGKSRAIADE